MLTNNFNRIVAWAANAPNANVFKDINNEDWVAGSNFGSVFSNIFALSNKKISDTSDYYSTFSIGSGETAVTANDYKLDMPIDETDFTITSNNRSYSGSSVILTQVWTYSGNSEVTIKEIGLFTKTMNSQGTKKPCLFAREVLDSPITVNNGDTFTVSMVIG